MIGRRCAALRFPAKVFGALAYVTEFGMAEMLLGFKVPCGQRRGEIE